MMVSSRLLKIVSVSAVISYTCVHPFVMVISHAMPASNVTGHHLKAGFDAVFLESFSVGMLPWSLGFTILGGLVGYFYYKNRQADEARTKLLNELQAALTEVKKLSGFLPICCVCKQIRDDKGYWNQVESYFHEYTNAKLSHSYCPDCAQKALDEYQMEEQRD
jgi:hypothetical protein